MQIIWDLTRPSLLKSYSQIASTSKLKVCLHRYRTFAVWPPSRCLASLWQSSLLRPARLWRYRQVCAVTTRPGTVAPTLHKWRLVEARLQGRRPLKAAARITGMVGFYQRGWQATSQSICMTCYPAWLVHRQQSHDVSTGCWHGWQPLCKHTQQLSPCFAQISSRKKTDHTYNLRSRHHSLSLAVKTDCNNFLNRLLFKIIY